VDLEDYVSYVGKTAMRADMPLMDVVHMSFEGVAGKWAQQFTKSLPAAVVNDHYANGEVYDAFHKAFLEYFSPQVRAQESRAWDELYNSKAYKQRSDEPVALYVTRFKALIKDAGGVASGTDAYLFREGFKADVKDQAVCLGGKLATLEECVQACLKAEDILLENAKSNPTKLSYAQAVQGTAAQGQPQGQPQGQQQGQGRSGRRRGRGGRQGVRGNGNGYVVRKPKAEPASAPNTMVGKADPVPQKRAEVAEGPAAMVEVRRGINVYTLVTCPAFRVAEGVHRTTISRHYMLLILLMMLKVTRNILIRLPWQVPLVETMTTKDEFG
jgi:hypothetical protein